MVKAESIMKTTLILSLLLAGFHFSAARDWISADGSRVFEGDLQDYDETTGQVTMLIAGETVTFSKDTLSKGDIKHLANYKEAEKNRVSIAQFLAKDKLSILKDGKFTETQLQKKPEYFLIYFSASW